MRSDFDREVTAPAGDQFDTRGEAHTLSARRSHVATGFRPTIMAVALMASTALGAQSVPSVQVTVDQPIAVSLQATQPALRPGARSFLVLQIAIPDGFWIGAAEGEVRSPGPTRLVLEEQPCVDFGKPDWPKARVEGIPVNLGVTRVYKGRISVVIPIHVKPDCIHGEHRVVARLTYTPGLNAGHLSSHIAERHETSIDIRADGASGEMSSAPVPFVQPSDDLHVQAPVVHLGYGLDTFFFELPETTGLARVLHKVWKDPENHGKIVRSVTMPIFVESRNGGTSAGLGFGFVNTTVEGIGTGAVNARLVDNEYLGTTAEFDVLSCPAAFHNYWLNGFVSEEGSAGVSFHLENLTRRNGRYGYEVQLDAFDDGRFRFFGVGADQEASDESAYAQRELGGTTDFYRNFTTYWRAAFGVGLRDVEIDDPADTLGEELPSTLAAYADTPGLEGGTVVSERVTLVYDKRNQEFTPSAGTYVRLRAEYNQMSSGSGPLVADDWARFEAIGTQYWSSPGQRYTLVARNEWQLTTGDGDLPFWAQPTLGGARNLRAFGEGRFHGDNSVYASMELRIQVMHVVVIGMPMDVELSPFVDAGQVFDDSFGGKFNVNPGMSMRVLNRPNVGLVVNWAYGQDGGQFTGGISLPF